MKSQHSIAIRRLLAFALDWLFVPLWGGILFGVVVFANNGIPPQPKSPWVGQGIGFVTMTVPFTLYFALCESSALRGSLGKRVLGLVVSRETGERLSFGSAFVRNALKFVPWELGHTVAQQAAHSGEAGLPAWVWGPAIISMVGPVWWLVAIVSTGRSPYDRWTTSRVQHSTDR